jgi:transcriptional regulator with XRE-family HTH domain
MSAPGPLGFAERLYDLRTARGLSQNQLANEIDCTGSMVSLWEKGANFPAFWNLVEICKFFGVDMDWLTGMPYVRNELRSHLKVREQLLGETI